MNLWKNISYINIFRLLLTFEIEIFGRNRYWAKSKHKQYNSVFPGATEEWRVSQSQNIFLLHFEAARQRQIISLFNLTYLHYAMNFLSFVERFKVKINSFNKFKRKCSSTFCVTWDSHSSYWWTYIQHGSFILLGKSL